jgi:hypothetical protein
MSAFCIGCACSDGRACIGGCSWLREDRAAWVGVCSRCEEHVARFDAGDRSLSEEAQLTIEDLAADEGFGLDPTPQLILPGDPDFHL